MRHQYDTTDTTGRRDLVIVAATAALALLLLGAAGGPLGLPLRPDDALRWAGDAEPALLAVAVLRTGGVLLAAHALVVALLGLLADVLRARPLARLAALLAVGPVRGVVLRGTTALLGTGLLLAPSAAAVAQPSEVAATPGSVADAGAQHGPVETARPLPPVQPAPPLPPVEAAPPLRPVEPTSSLRPVEAARPLAAVGPAADVAGAPAAGQAGDDVSRWRTVTVRPGDHLWGLAARDVAAHLGSAPDDRAVHRHWTAVVEANRDRLVVPDDPDLVLPDQRLVLPPLEGA